MGSPITYVCGRNLTVTRDYCKKNNLGFPSHYILVKPETLASLSNEVHLLLVDGFWDRPDSTLISQTARQRRMKVEDLARKAA